MQRLFSFTKTLSRTLESPSHFIAYHHNPFTSFTKPILTNSKNQIFRSFEANPVRQYHSFQQPHHALPVKPNDGFLANPLLQKQLFSKALNIQCRRSFSDAKVWFFRARGGGGGGKVYHFDPVSGSFKGGGRSSWFKQLTTEQVVWSLILANVAVYCLWRLADPKFMADNFMISVDNVRRGRIHTMITSAFSQNELGHLASNMLGLYIFGTSIGSNFGPRFLLKLYLAGAIGGSVFYLVYHSFIYVTSKEQMWNSFSDPSRTRGLGASGAVNAITLLGIFMNPRAIIYVNLIIPVPAALVGMGIIGMDLLRVIRGDGNVSGAAHLGGAAVAAFYLARVKKGRF